MPFTQEEMDNYFFQKDSLFDEIYGKLSKNKYITDAYSKAKYIRELLSRNIALNAFDLSLSLNIVNTLDENFAKLPDHLKKLTKSTYYNRNTKISKGIYKDLLFDQFLDSYNKSADRFQNYEIELLHRSYSHVHKMIDYETKVVNKSREKAVLPTRVTDFF